MSEKVKVIKVADPKGGEELVFKFVPRQSNNEDINCDTICPYANICEKICDPNHLGEEGYNFVDFCAKVEIDRATEEAPDDEEASKTTYIPAEGSLEEAFKNHEDILKQIVDKDPVVRVSKLIDNFCCDFCDSYDEEHTNCTSDNRSCILRKLFIK